VIRRGAGRTSPASASAGTECPAAKVATDAANAHHGALAPAQATKAPHNATNTELTTVDPTG